jgi:transcriptional regulator GlxA family with amidase domain
MHRIVFVVIAPVMAHDLAVATAVLGEARVDGGPAYELRIVAAEPGRVASFAGPDLVIADGLSGLAGAHTLFVVGGGPEAEPGEEVLQAVKAAHAAEARLVASCTGAFVLARAGLLDGRRATTHWNLLDELARRFPAVRVERDALYVEDGRVLTSAGAAAVIEICLHLIRTDHGSAVAAEAARQLVAAPARPADQPQLVAPAPRPSVGGAERRGLAETRAWAQGRLDEPVSLAELASHAKVSPRTFTRRFRAETGLSPLRWLLEQRIDLARQLLETTELTMDRVAERSGLGSADSLRMHFVRTEGVTPSAYRAAYVLRTASRASSAT